MKKILIMMFLILGMIFASHADTKREITSEIDKQSKELWDKYIHNKDDLILDNWGLVKCTLYRQAGDKLDNRLASFATVAFAGVYRTRVGNVSFDEKDLIIYAQNLKGTALTNAEKEEIKKLYEKIRKKFGKRSTPFRLGTFGMGKAFYLGLTVNDKSWLEKIKAKCGIAETDNNEPKEWTERALYRMSKYHGWHAVLEKTANATFLQYKEAIDKNIPVLLLKNDYYQVLVGYLTADKKCYLIIADLAKIPVEMKGMSALPDEIEYFNSLPPDNPRRIGWEYKQKHYKFPMDLVVRSTMPLHPGFRIELFEKGKYHAYFIHGWRKSLEAWEPEIRKIVGNKKKDASNSK